MTYKEYKGAPANPSQYNGTTNNHVCPFCKKTLNHLTRQEQDRHEKRHNGQMRL